MTSAFHRLVELAMPYWNSRRRFVVGCLTTMLLVLACRRPIVTSGGDEAAIRASRERSNRAIAAHDTSGIAAPWSDSILVIASTGARSLGREANARRFAEQFQSRPDVRYVRTPERIQQYAAWAMAVEEGRWVGRWTDGASRIEIGGRYLARWRRERGEWRIVAEVYAPTYCSGGAYCERQP
jgi:ketosteroid isomerase-like protein